MEMGERNIHDIHRHRMYAFTLPLSLHTQTVHLHDLRWRIRSSLANINECWSIIASHIFDSMRHRILTLLSRQLSTETEARLKAMEEMRRQYAKQTSIVRKKYAAEIQEKRLKENKAEEDRRAEVDRQKAVRDMVKKEKKAVRAIEFAEEAKMLQAAIKERKAVNAANRARIEGRQGYIRFKRMEEIRRQSSMWIEEKDLERRILDAIANPYHLAGSSVVEVTERDDSYYEDDDV